MQQYCGPLLTAVLISLLAGSAYAQHMSFTFREYRRSPEVNLYLSARYDRLLQTSPSFRAYRMWKECYTIDIPPLHGDCIASFDQYEPMLPR